MRKDPIGVITTALNRMSDKVYDLSNAWLNYRAVDNVRSSELLCYKLKLPVNYTEGCLVVYNWKLKVDENEDEKVDEKVDVNMESDEKISSMEVVASNNDNNNNTNSSSNTSISSSNTTSSSSSSSGIVAVNVNTPAVLAISGRYKTFLLRQLNQLLSEVVITLLNPPVRSKLLLAMVEGQMQASAIYRWLVFTLDLDLNKEQVVTDGVIINYRLPIILGGTGGGGGGGDSEDDDDDDDEDDSDDDGGVARRRKLRVENLALKSTRRKG